MQLTVELHFFCIGSNFSRFLLVDLYIFMNFINKFTKSVKKKAYICTHKKLEQLSDKKAFIRLYPDRE